MSSVLSLILFSVLFYSCEKEETISNENLKSEETVTLQELSKVMPPGEVELECAGNCDCALDYDLNTSIFSCSCSDCHMDIHFLKSAGKVENKDLVLNSILNSDFAKVTASDLKKYSIEKFKSEIKSFNKIKFSNSNNIFVLIFEFETESGVNESVLYYEKIDNTNETNKVIRPKYRVDCEGSCGCREEYNFTTNTASCSCSECSMTITQL